MAVCERSYRELRQHQAFGRAECIGEIAFPQPPLGVSSVECRMLSCGPWVVPTRLRGRSRFLTYGQNCFGVAKARLRGRSRFLTYGQNCFGVAKARLRGRSRFLTYGQNCFGVAKARSGFAGWRTR